MLRAAASISATASSAAETMLEVGALTTMTPGLGRGLHVDVVEADTGAGDDLEPVGGGQRLGVHLGRGAHQDRVDVGDRGQQLRAVGAVAVSDLEVRAERLDGGGAQLFGDENDGAVSHSGLSFEASCGVMVVHVAVPPLTVPDASSCCERVSGLEDALSVHSRMPIRARATSV